MSTPNPSNLNSPQSELATSFARNPISDIADKLGHILPEIRFRAAKSLSLKLDAGLVEPADLVHDHHLASQLVRALDESLKGDATTDVTTQQHYETPSTTIKQSNVDPVLSIILRLATHPPTCRRLIQSGAIAALQQLKLRVNAETGHLADMALKQLLYMRGDDEPGKRTRTGGDGWEGDAGTEKGKRTDEAHQILVSNSFPVFPYIHPSLQDESLIDTFAGLVSNVRLDEHEFTVGAPEPGFISWDLETHLFDVLALDFGAAVFLQRAGLFRGILAGLSSSDFKRFARSLQYLDQLSFEWAKALRRAADTVEHAPPSTSRNGTPNVTASALPGLGSVNGTGNIVGALSESDLRGLDTARIESSVATPDDSVSVTYAAHEIVMAALKVMRARPENFSGLVELCHNLIPFIALHVESVTEIKGPSADRSGDNSLLFRFHLIKTYLWVLVETAIAVGDNAIGSEKAVEVGTRSNKRVGLGVVDKLDILLEMALDLVVATMRVPMEPEAAGIFWGSLDFLLDSCVFPNFSRVLTSAVTHRKWRTRSDKLEILDDVLILLMRHTNLNVVITVYQTIRDSIRHVDNDSPGCILTLNILYEVTTALQGNSEVLQSVGLEILRLALIGNLECPPQLVVACLPWLQSAQGLDNGALMERAYTKVSEHLTLDQKCELFLRGRLHKNANARLWATQRLKELLGMGSEVSLEEQNGLLFSYSVRTALEGDVYHLAVGQSHSDCSEPFHSLLPSVGADYQKVSEMLRSHIVMLKISRKFSPDWRDIVVLQEWVTQTTLEEQTRRPICLCLHFLNMAADLNDGAVLFKDPHSGFLRKLGELSYSSDMTLRYELGLLVSKVFLRIELFCQSDKILRIATARSMLDNFAVSSNVKAVDMEEGPAEITTESANTIWELAKEDIILVRRIVIFFGKALRKGGGTEELRSLLLSCFQGVFSTLAAKGLHQALIQPLDMDLEDAEGNRELHHFTTDVVQLLRWFLAVCPDEDVVRLASTTSWLHSLRNLTEFQFALETASSKTHVDRLNCLYCLLSFMSLPSVTALVDGDVIASVIHLFVQILGLLQEKYFGGTNGGDFTYEDRSVYRAVALGLRNASRSITVYPEAERPWMWGDHWLYQNDIDWLSLMLTDDERQIQKCALGILGNLTLIKGSYQHLCVKIPQFLDMAFSYVLDWERPEGPRKEALQIINNFLITFCHDNGLDNARLVSQAESAPRNNGESSSDMNYTYNPVKELLGIFEACGFFEKLADVLNVEVTQPEYRLALAELLVNLCIVAPEFFRNLFCDLSIWRNLCRNLQDEPSDYARTQAPALQLYRNFVAGQFDLIYRVDVDLIRTRTLQTIWILTHNSDSVKKVVLTTRQRLWILQSVAQESSS
ncbi:hypothetical protein HDU93_007989 [Gonapodya sp. JEL0774]|nr:hypothetical protein HDU93_007989 [Gonapodya sp. JEL0774]